MASVGDEVTHTLIEESSGAIVEDGQVAFIYEVAERFFVLRYDLRYTTDVACNNLEIEGNAHTLKLKNTKQKTLQSEGLLCSLTSPQVGILPLLGIQPS